LIFTKTNFYDKKDMKYLKHHFICAIFSAVITTAIILFELFFLSSAENFSTENLSQNKNFYITLVCTYLLVFFLNYALSLICTEIAGKIIKNWILVFCAGFAVYFALLSVIIYASIIIGEPSASINFADLFMARLKTDIILSLQNFTIAFAFIRLANKKISQSRS